MSIDWWIHGSRHTSPDGQEAFVRVGTVLYMQRGDDPKFYELDVRDDSKYGPGFSTGVFRWEDYRTGDSGVLTCTEQTCTVQRTGDPEPVTYSVVTPAGEFPHVRLHEFDRRQVPAMLFAIEGTAQMVYFSCWVHGFRREMDGQPLTVSRMFIVDNHNSTRQTITEIVGISGDGFEVRRHYWVDTPDLGTLNVPRPDWEGDGTWGDSTLRRLDLERYEIVHDTATGKLVSIKRR